MRTKLVLDGATVLFFFRQTLKSPLRATTFFISKNVNLFTAKHQHQLQPLSAEEMLWFVTDCLKKTNTEKLSSGYCFM